MSPRKFLDGDHKQHTKSRVDINGPRPTPLKLKQESHTIHKDQHHQHHQQQQQQQQKQIIRPIIIYTRSPKVIHTKPHDFMALVQKLTGRSRSKDQQQQKTKKKTLEDNKFYNELDVTHEINNIRKSKSPMFDAPLDRYVSDIPLFTPNSSDYFFSPQSLLRLSDAVSSSPNKTTSMSPGSLVEFMKRLPKY